MWADTGKPLGVFLDVSLAWETTKKGVVADKGGFAGPHSHKFTMWPVSSLAGPCPGFVPGFGPQGYTLPHLRLTHKISKGEKEFECGSDGARVD